MKRKSKQKKASSTKAKPLSEAPAAHGLVRRRPGQPTKYLPEYSEQIIELCGRGMYIEEFAHEIRVHKDTLYEWAKHHPDFSDALKLARQGNKVHFMKILRAGGTGKILNYNASSIIFALKACHGLSDISPMDAEENQEWEFE